MARLLITVVFLLVGSACTLSEKRLVSREQYEECRQEIDVTGTIESVLILDVRDKPLTIYGLPPGTPSKEVEVRVTTDESEYTATCHAVRVGDSLAVGADRQGRPRVPAHRLPA